MYVYTENEKYMYLCIRNKYANKFVFMQMGTMNKEREGEEGEVTSVKLFNVSWAFCSVFSTLIIVCYI